MKQELEIIILVLYVSFWNIWLLFCEIDFIHSWYYLSLIICREPYKIDVYAWYCIYKPKNITKRINNSYKIPRNKPNVGISYIQESY